MAIIDTLPALTTPTTGDELPIERGTTVYKIDYNQLAAAIGRILRTMGLVVAGKDRELAAALGGELEADR